MRRAVGEPAWRRAQGAQYNSGADQRIIKMQDMPVDPMEPPKFRHKKARRPARPVPPVPPVPRAGPPGCHVRRRGKVTLGR